MSRLNLFVAGIALAALVASPAMAQRQGIGESAPQVNTRVHPEGARYGASAYRARAQFNPAGDRDAAMRECTELSRKYAESTWGTLQVGQQRACMAEHGQPE